MRKVWDCSICNISFTTRIKLKKQYNWVRKIVETNQSSAASCYGGPVVHQLTDRSGDSYRDWFWQNQGAHERRHPPVNRPFADRLQSSSTLHKYAWRKKEPKSSQLTGQSTIVLTGCWSFINGLQFSTIFKDDYIEFKNWTKCILADYIIFHFISLLFHRSADC